MDGFSYVNIFETKGIEYLVIIAFLVMLIPFMILLNKKTKIVHEIRKAISQLSVNILNIPQGLFYSRNHTWTYLEKSGSAMVGLDDLLLHITGEVKLKQLRSSDEIINKGDLLAEIEQENKHLRIFSPISGKIMQMNPLLAEDAEMINKDPYGQGWMYKIQPSNWKAETSSYYMAAEATEWIKKELLRLKDFLAVRAGQFTPDPSMVTLQDGGELYDNLLSDMPDGIWEDFQKEFLDPK